jgi:hypothetical protein
MDEPVVKKGKVGRPKGAKNKTSEPVGRGRGKLREALEDSLTQKDIEKLSPVTKAGLLAKLEPRAPSEGPTTIVKLVIRGINGWVCEFCGQAQAGKGGVEGPVAPPLDVPAADAPPDTAASWQAVEDVKRRGQHYPQPSPGPTRRAPVLVPEEEDPPVQGPIFTVPSYDDLPEAHIPAEWRKPIPGYEKD